MAPPSLNYGYTRIVVAGKSRPKKNEKSACRGFGDLHRLAPLRRTGRRGQHTEVQPGKVDEVPFDFRSEKKSSEFFGKFLDDVRSSCLASRLSPKGKIFENYFVRLIGTPNQNSKNGVLTSVKHLASTRVVAEYSSS